MAEPAVAPAACFHCGLPIPAGLRITAHVAGVVQPMCCVGCQAVAELLDAQGLADWYAHREGPTGFRPDPVPEILESWNAIPLDDDLAGLDPRTRETTLLVEGVTCGACVWLIERHLERLTGVRSARVDLMSRRVRITWDPEALDLSEIVARLGQIGFRARPDRPDVRADLDREESRAALIRLGVAGLATMNVMTYAVALYAGAFEPGGMARGFEGFFRWLSLLVTTPVVLVSARPFFVGALRDLRLGRPGMDVPVALAIGGAYLLSTWATLRGSGEVYFDSVCMFTFLLGLGRYLELCARHRSASLSRRLWQAGPAFARRLEEGREQLVPAAALRVGDRFVVRPGETLAADGSIVEGASGVEEALLTGEPWPRSVSPGDDVIAGSVNTASPLVVEARRVGSETTLAAVIALMERAQSEKPAIAALADRAAAVFVVFVLALAAGAAVYWGLHAPDRAIWITLAVLIATCPCALGLATPAALTAATHGLAEAGLLVTRGHVLEGLATANRIVLDKTGTITRGEPTLLAWVALRPEIDRRTGLAIARALEARSEHPLARALRDAPLGDRPVALVRPASVEKLASRPGMGVEGRVGGRRTRIGRPEWVQALAPGSFTPAPPREKDRSWVLLGDTEGPIAWLGFGDEIRAEARAALRRLARQGLALELLTGDPSSTAIAMAERLGIADATIGATPDAKVTRLEALERGGERVVMVGDGVNDGPVLSAARVSIAMGSGSDLARLGADAILLRDDLALLPTAIAWSRRVRRVIRQNLAWAVAYNAIALPLALSGTLAPWLAAAGMSASSLVVVLNSMRLQHAPGHTTGRTTREDT